MGKAENEVERYLHNEVVKMGGYTFKWTSPQHSNVPDRIIMLPSNLWFIEAKTLNEKPTSGQFREINRIIRLGHQAGWVGGKSGVDKFLEKFK